MVSATQRGDESAPPFISPKVARALTNPLRARILVELNKREMSPSQFASEFGYPLDKISRKFRELRKYDCIELVAEKQGEGRRGGTESFYRATQRAMFDDSTWKELPRSLRARFSGVIFNDLVEQVAQAMEAGTLDAREERHLTWTALRYDQQAWEEIIERLDELFRRSQELQVEAALRMAKSGEDPIPVTVALAGFESPPTNR